MRKVIENTDHPRRDDLGFVVCADEAVTRTLALVYLHLKSARAIVERDAILARAFRETGKNRVTNNAMHDAVSLTLSHLRKAISFTAQDFCREVWDLRNRRINDPNTNDLLAVAQALHTAARQVSAAVNTVNIGLRMTDGQRFHSEVVIDEAIALARAAFKLLPETLRAEITP